MALVVREDPIGDLVKCTNDGTMFEKRKPKAGEATAKHSKVVFSKDPVTKVNNKGHWFELRVEDFSAGYMSLVGLGFTATDPATLVSEEEGTVLPAKAYDIPRTYLSGYARSTFWDGSRVQGEDLFKKLKCFNVFTLGVLATPEGSLELYMDRQVIHTFDPTFMGLPPMPVDEPLWMVIDVVGGLWKGRIMNDSEPPSLEERLDRPVSQ
eukprot:gnl/TRDRNA2_/TRDRNA2_183339_c0_seq1.p1 gnl/TRDRNA2_/TRDRNA2_183339_c0~~gnl/TRDRNA2_/TRDRNA2_183339_c0_seq1.p1  ORF type:complete len:209 (-),score=46.25 gnl/TRDRNA2_/TRDRNA2_183339_c0_seq1:72-698(-)